jgi:predicted metal-dependent phosphotriesterase family hydrolase
LAEENFVHDFFSQRSIRRSVSVLSEVLHQPMMVITAREAGLMPLEVIPRVHLGNHQGNRGARTIVESDLSGAGRDVLKVAHH